MLQVGGEVVLLDDPVVVVDESGAERPEIDQKADGGQEQDGALGAHQCFLEPT